MTFIYNEIILIQCECKLMASFHKYIGYAHNIIIMDKV